MKFLYVLSARALEEFEWNALAYWKSRREIKKSALLSIMDFAVAGTSTSGNKQICKMGLYKVL